MKEYKEIFIFVSGSTPQIITETIYALATKKPPIHPDEIIVITTTEGAKRAKEELENKGILKKLFDEYKIPPVEIKYDVPSDKKGIPLEDIRTNEDNEQMADRINTIVREKAKQPDTRLHCSIAGGRKTMSFYLGSALQLYGRSQDKLYHVLVTPEFESNRNFYYKPKKNKKIKTADGRELNTDDAKITLAELPFIRIGEKVDIVGKGYSDSIKSGQQAIDEAIFKEKVSVDLKDRCLKIGKIEIKLEPIQLALYATLLTLKKNCKKKDCSDCYECHIHRKSKWDNKKIVILKRIYEKTRPLAELKLIDDNGIIGSERLATLVSKVNKKIADVLQDNGLSVLYKIKSKRQYGDTKYYVALPKNLIGDIK